MKMLKKIVLTLCLMCVCASCATLKDDVFIASNAAETAQPELGEIELKLVKQLSSFNQSEMQEIYHSLTALLAVPSTDRNYLARVNALTADYYILNKNQKRAKIYAEAALKQNNLDEYALLVNAKCMKDTEALDYLSAMCDRFENSHRLSAYLGHLYYKAGEYNLAVAAFDKGLPFLDEVYVKAYSNERATAYKNYTLGDDFNETTALILTKENMPLIDMTTVTNENTDVFNVITGNARWKSSMIADRLRAAGWYRSDALLTTDNTTRKDTAIFLWHLICAENESKLNQYSNKYRTRSRSPIADVPLGAEFFDAALAMIEYDIMQLVDGKYFSPDAPVSGAAFYTFLQKAENAR